MLHNKPAECLIIQLNSDTLLGDSIRSYRLRVESYKTAPLPIKTQIANLGYHLCFDLNQEFLKSRVPKIPSPGWINLREQLIELRETFHLRDYQSIIKDYNSGIARWKRCVGWGMGKGRAAFMSSLGKPLSPVSTCSSIWMLSEPYPFGVLWRFHYTDITD